MFVMVLLHGSRITICSKCQQVLQWGAATGGEWKAVHTCSSLTISICTKTRLLHPLIARSSVILQW